jgi:hypothetical protein
MLAVMIGEKHHLTKNIHYERLIIRYRSDPGDRMGDRIFCLFGPRYYTRIVSYCDHRFAAGGYQAGLKKTCDKNSSHSGSGVAIVLAGIRQ